MVQPQPQIPSSKGERTATRVLDAAQSLFASHGFAGTSMSEIAAAAGIKKASLYNHFKSKEELYDAVLQRGFEPMLTVITEFLARGKEAYSNPRLIEPFFERMAEMPDFARLVQFEALQGGERLKTLIGDMINQGARHGVQALKGSEHGKQWSDQDLKHLIFASFALVSGYFTLAPMYELYLGASPEEHSSQAAYQQFLSRLWHQIWYIQPD